MDGLTFGPVEQDDIQQAYALELAGFPPDEAASLDTMRHRQRVAADFFLGARSSSSGQLVGFVSATLTSSPSLTHDSMDRHDPDGRTLAVHSVCVSPAHRRRRVASSLLARYLSLASRDGRVDRVVLICHHELIPLYSAAGFGLVGKSDVQHGEREWYEMAVDVAPSEKPDLPTDPAALSALLAAASATTKTLPTTEFSRAEQPGDAVCPAPGCGCIIFKAGAARWTADSRLDSFDIPPLPPTLESPSSLNPSGYWSLANPLAFENVAFSRPAPSSSSSTPASTRPQAARYLACGACELGPIGFMTDDPSTTTTTTTTTTSLHDAVERQDFVGKGFWILPDRVRYRAGPPS